MTPTQERLHAEAVARKKRYMMAVKSAKVTNDNADVSHVIDECQAPKPTRLEFDHNSHVIAWRHWMKRYAGKRIKAYIEQRCRDEGFSSKEVFGVSRRHVLTNFRMLLVWEVKTKVSPDASLNDLGRVFNRDHTTIYNALKKMAKKHGVEFLGNRKGISYNGDNH